MALLYGALAYMIGLALARWWWEYAAISCPLAGAWWPLPLVLLPAAAQLRQRRGSKPHPPLRWPEEAGFARPAQGPAPALLAGLLLCVGAGMLRYGSRPFSACWGPGELAYYNLPANQVFAREAQQVTVDGIVASYPLVADGRQELEVAAKVVHVGDAAHAVAGSVRVTAASAERLRYGQRVAVTGRMAEPGVFEGFSYKDYLAIRGVGSVMYGARVQVLDARQAGNPLLRGLYQVRAGSEALIGRSLAEPYAALANGMLLGIEANIPDELYDAFDVTGTRHVIVISGTNVALISGIIVAAAARLLGKRNAAWPALGAIACYALLVGGDATVLRASIMGGLFVTAAALRRRSTALVSLAAACMALTLANPLELWDPGLHLSGMATAGLILLAPTLASGLRPFLRSAYGWLRAAGEDVLAMTLAANIMTLPLALYYFGRFSLVSLPANLLVTPVQPLILIGGSAALLCGLAGGTAAAAALLWPVWLGLAWTVAVVEWAAGLPFAALTIHGFGLLQLAAAYAVIGLALWRRNLQATACAVAAWTRGTRLLTAQATLLGAAVLAALLWVAALAQPDGRLHVWFLDVGQGDGILIQTPSGRQVLIDGGASGQALLGELGAVMPFWDRDLDLVALTHPDADHMNGQLEAAARFAIAAAWETSPSAANPAGSAWRMAVEAAGAEVQLQHAGGWADLGDGVALWVLGPQAQPFAGEDADNQNSLVAKLVYGDFQVLLMGDAGAAAEAQLLATGAPLAATVLKVAHHGSKLSTSAALVAAANPLLAVIQVGAENDYGHPHPEVLERLAGRTVLRTDEQGRVHVWSDGQQVGVEVE